jgi:glycosyltransferase involved in cell wall biosynthesis
VVTPPAARLIDLTRLVSRLGRGALTGVDRVELAYLMHLAAAETPLYALVRTAAGFVLLDRDGARMIARLATADVGLGPPDLLSRLFWRGDTLRARAESAARRLAIARCARPLLARMLRRQLPPGSSYLNVGHANLSARALSAIRAAGLRVAVLVHDAIPLDYPQYTRPGIPQVFARKMAAVAAHADLVIYSTDDARTRTEAHFARMGRVPPGVVAALGVPLRQPDRAAIPPGLDLARPYFVTLGTIEPRKNHALLLDVWDRMQANPTAAPQLFIIGGRGWANEDVFRRLDALPSGSPVRELPGLPDGAVAALLQGAQALLFPSHAEGYGLPPVEAAALGVPVIAAPLAVTRETLGDYPVYLDPSDSYSWLETINNWGQQGRADRNRRASRAVPRWEDHFNRVLNLV